MGISARKIVIWSKLPRFSSVLCKNYVYMMTLRYFIDTYQIRGLFVIEYATIVKKQPKTAGFFLRFHIFKSGVSYSSGPVITKCGFWWFQKLTQVFIFHIRHVLVFYHTYFRFSAHLADPTPKNQPTCVYIRNFSKSL